MAIDYNAGINSIDVGAHDITYSGNQGPKSPEQKQMMAFDDTPVFELRSLDLLLEEFREDNNGRDPVSIDDLRRHFYIKYGPQGIAKVEKAVQQQEQQAQMQQREGIQMASAADPMLEEQYQQYVFEMEEQGLQPMSFREFMQQALSGMAYGGSANPTYTQKRKQSLAYGGIAGVDGRKRYGIGSWFQGVKDKFVDDIIPNEIKENPLATTLAGGALLNQFGLPDMLTKNQYWDFGTDVGQNWLGDLLGKDLVYGPGGEQFPDYSNVTNVVNIIQSYSKNFSQGNLDPKKLNIIAIIPSKGPLKKNGKDFLIRHTIKEAKKSKFIKKVIVSTDNKQTRNFAIKNGAECPFLRPKKLSMGNVNLRTVQKFSLSELERNKIFPDLIIHLEETYPFRDKDLIDQAIKVLLKNGYDTVIAAKEEKGWLWKEDTNGYLRIEEGDIPEKIKKKNLFRIAWNLLCYLSRVC